MWQHELMVTRQEKMLSMPGTRAPPLLFARYDFAGEIRHILLEDVPCTACHLV